MLWPQTSLSLLPFKEMHFLEQPQRLMAAHWRTQSPPGPYVSGCPFINRITRNVIHSSFCLQNSKKQYQPQSTFWVQTKRWGSRMAQFSNILPCSEQTTVFHQLTGSWSPVAWEYSYMKQLLACQPPPWAPFNPWAIKPSFRISRCIEKN